ncbi:HAD family hydrolase [Nostoc flagelliforme FACHB-838]|uniref:HAD family hydrolase n=1 Tax=Nostoc flagelliforme FACHB-838 TaxID=2692904 RepID=A0ABR8E4B8_9NOSO|nr:HAD family hydrolase [Nostoc flagelliforme]MBD2535932.1 HAD family hydrolase [Nostoc flagelliforme FACHB-838]
MAVNLVIFDCDGVLVDSEPLTNRALTYILNDIGIKITYEEVLETFVGKSFSNCLEIIEYKLQRPLSKSFSKDFEEITFKLFEQELKPVDGVTEILDSIMVKTCIASSGSHEKLSKTLSLTGLLPRFTNRIFSVTEVTRGKPYPDIFLHAANEMGEHPKNCVVIEDSIPGVLAAVAANMKVFGYAERTDPQRLAQAGAIVFNSMKQLPELLNSI